MAKVDLAMILKWVAMYKYDREIVGLFVNLFSQYCNSGA